MPAYTLFRQPASPAALTADATAYTMGVQFSVTKPGTLTAVWFYSAPGAAALPGTIALYAVSGTSLIHSEAASWSGAAGSGWVRAAFSSPPQLAAGTAYKAVVLQGTAVNWYSTTGHYWDTGPGQNGITSGPVTAPGNAGASPGQDSFFVGAGIAYPNTSSNASNYWVDPEVTATAAGLVPTLAMAL